MVYTRIEGQVQAEALRPTLQTSTPDSQGLRKELPKRDAGFNRKGQTRSISVICNSTADFQHKKFQDTCETCGGNQEEQVQD